MRDTKRTCAISPPPRPRSYTAVKAEWEALIVAWARRVLAAWPREWERIGWPVNVHFSWGERDAHRDPDGIASGGSKLILDGLVKAGVMPDDTHRTIRRLLHDFVCAPGAHGVRVWFEWWGPGSMIFDCGHFPHRLPDLNELLALREASARRSVKSQLRGRLA